MKKTVMAVFFTASTAFLGGCVTQTAYYPGYNYYGTGVGYSSIGFGGVYNTGYYYGNRNWYGNRYWHGNRGWGNAGWGNRGWGNHGWGHGWRR